MNGRAEKVVDALVTLEGGGLLVHFRFALGFISLETGFPEICVDGGSAAFSGDLAIEFCDDDFVDERFGKTGGAEIGGVDAEVIALAVFPGSRLAAGVRCGAFRGEGNGFGIGREMGRGKRRRRRSIRGKVYSGED